METWGRHASPGRPSDPRLRADWKDFKENYAHEYNLGVDGALTITDGVKIYRIAEGFMRKPEMSVYSIGEN
jgi:hypothetical protein